MVKTKPKTEEEFANVLLVEGINSRGYGMIPKVIMEDPRPSAYAKLIYAYFCSYTSAGSHSAFPSVSKILKDLKITNKTYYKHFKDLTDYGYITVHKQKRKDGKFERNLYVLNQFPTVVEKLLHGEEDMSYPQKNGKKYEKTEDKSIVENLPYGKTSSMESLPHGKISTTNNTNSFNNTNNKHHNINLDEFGIPAHFYYDWMNEE